MMLRTSSLATKVTPKRSLAESSTRKLMGQSQKSTNKSNKWKNRELRSGCFTGVRCHNRLMKTTADKEVDKQLLENDEEEWKSVVRGLVEAARRATRAQIKNRETHIDSGQVEHDRLLTKSSRTRFSGGGYGSDTASESFERRLQCSDHDHENELGEKQIRTQDNVSDSKVTGKRTTTAATKSSRRGRDVKRQKIQAEAAKRVERESRRDRGQDF